MYICKVNKFNSQTALHTIHFYCIKFKHHKYMYITAERKSIFKKITKL